MSILNFNTKFIDSATQTSLANHRQNRARNDREENNTGFNNFLERASDNRNFEARNMQNRQTQTNTDATPQTLQNNTTQDTADTTINTEFEPVDTAAKHNAEIANQYIASYDTNYDTEEISYDIISAIATILNILPQDLAKLLDNLDINPTELDLPQNKTALLTQLNGLADQIELLSIESTPQLLQEIDLVLEEYIQAKPVFEQIIPENDIQNIETKTNEANLNHLQETFADNTIEHEVSTPLINTNTEINQENTEVGFFESLETQVASVAIEPKQEVPIFEQTQGQTTQPTPDLDIALVNLANIVNNTQPINITPLQTTNISTQNIMQQILQPMRLWAGGEVTELSIKLKPEHLGNISVKIATINGIVAAQFIAENQRVKEIIESQFNQLRESLEGQGINISQIDVSVSSDSQGQSQQFGFEGTLSSSRIDDIIAKNMEDEAQQALQQADDASVVSGLDLKV